MTPPKGPFLGISFECCRTYARIYRNREGTAYEGRCPRCGMRVRVAIGPDGTKERFFLAHPRVLP
jgi:PHP family Zn ribbon phosphoesterase